MARTYGWGDLFREATAMYLWHTKKPKWWQFRKRKEWKRNCPVKDWEGM